MSYATDPTLGKMAILSGEEKMVDGLNMLARFEQWTWKDAWDFIAVAVWEPNKRRILYHLLEISRDAGARYPAQIPSLRLELYDAMPESFHMADHVGGLTGLGSIVFEPQSGDKPWRKFHPDLLLANLDEGRFGKINGPPGSGKTNVTVYNIKRWIAQQDTKNGGRHFSFSNIKPRVEGQWNYVTSARQLFYQIAFTSTLNDRWVFWLDEAGVVYSKADASTRRAKDLDKLCKMIRHFHGNMVLVEQRPESVPQTVQDFSRTNIFCEKPGTIAWELKGPHLADRDRAARFPKDEDFDTYQPTFFRTTDLDIMRLFDYVAGKPDMYQAMRDFLEGKGYVRETKIAGKPSDRKCLFCGAPLPPNSHPAMKFCSKEHQRQARLERMRQTADEIGISSKEEDGV